MVETWEIEWNSSMIEHGVDLGTMEFIFAKGGNLTDVNYVMLNQHDDTWEPLIKAVAERDNSHPDIIRKNVPQPQQPQQPFGVNQGFVPAISGTVGNTNTAFRNARDARRLLGAQRALDSQAALEQGQRTVGNLARTGQYGQAAGRAVAQTGRGVVEGVKGMGRGIAGAGRFVGDKAGQAGRFLADKFPGASERMRDFMGVAGNYREGRRQAKDQARKDKAAGMRRDVLQGDLNRLEDQRARARREAGTDAGERHRQLVAIAQTPLAQKEEEMRQQLAEKKSSLEGPRPNRFRRALDISRQNRGLQQTPEQMQEARQAEQDANEGTVEAINQEIDSASEGLKESVNTDSPPPPAINPTPAPAEPPKDEEMYDLTLGEGENEQPQDEEMYDLTLDGDASQEDDERGRFADQMLDTAGYTGGTSRKKAREVALGLFDKPESYEAITSATGSRGYRTKLAQAVAAYHGMSPAQADATVQSAEQGNPDAKQKVEEATSGEQAQVMFPDSAGSDDGDDDPAAAPLALFSSDKHIASWDALLKGLNIR